MRFYPNNSQFYMEHLKQTHGFHEGQSFLYAEHALILWRLWINNPLVSGVH